VECPFGGGVEIRRNPILSLIVVLADAIILQNIGLSFAGWLYRLRRAS
jgi:hypothetical protein